MRKTTGRIMRRALFVSTCVVGLGACAAGPDYRPPAPLPEASAGPFVSAAPGTSAEQPQGRWWRLYDDPALDSLIGKALVANTDLRVAAANLARAQAVLRESHSGRLPSTDLSGGASYGDGSGVAGQGSGKEQWSYTGGMGISWEVDLFGRITRSIEAARADRDATAAARDRVAVIVAAETARAYTGACVLAESGAVARESIAIAQRGLEIVTTQQRVGTASRLDVERAAAALANARAALPPLEGARQYALFELAALMGLPPAQVPEEARRCTRMPQPVSPIPVGDGQGLIARRPDVREAERQLAADTARIGVATADLYPRIALGGSGNFFRNDQVKGSDSFSFSFGPLLSWSFPNIAVARARIAQAEAGAQASLARFDGAVLTALKEVEQALTMVAAEAARREALADAANRASTAYDLANRRYRAGSLSFLELLDTQRTLLDARATLASADRTLGSARIDLFKALGGGWQDIAPLSPAPTE
ncbi:TolC family protein [Caenibius sp. WL]|uniref:efflux transporter outer membrane subunit n=1 Tax=Caenibius sp. WL TaxID=2872646 RepID=UPI001C99BAE8